MTEKVGNDLRTLSTRETGPESDIITQTSARPRRWALLSQNICGVPLFDEIDRI